MLCWFYYSGASSYWPSTYFICFVLYEEFVDDKRVIRIRKSLFHYQDFYQTWLYIWVTRMSYKKQEPLTLREHLSSPLFFGGFRFVHVFNFVLFYCVYLRSEFHVVMSLTILAWTLCSVPLCPLCWDRVLFMLFVVGKCIMVPTHIVLCFCFVLFFFVCTLSCQFLWIVRLWLLLRCSPTLFTYISVRWSWLCYFG